MPDLTGIALTRKQSGGNFIYGATVFHPFGGKDWFAAGGNSTCSQTGQKDQDSCDSQVHSAGGLPQPVQRPSSTSAPHTAQRVHPQDSHIIGPFQTETKTDIL